jgi:hypothetical protein
MCVAPKSLSDAGLGLDEGARMSRTATTRKRFQRVGLRYACHVAARAAAARIEPGVALI